MSRLRGEPGVTAVTFSSALPGLGPDRRIEFQPSTKIRDAGDLEVATFRIDVDLLRVYEARLLAGRGFEARDVGAARAAIVNRTFVDDLLEPVNRERSARSSATRRIGTAARRPTGTRSSASSTISPACRALRAREGNRRCTTRWSQEPRTPPCCRSNSAPRRLHAGGTRPRPGRCSRGGDGDHLDAREHRVRDQRREYRRAPGGRAAAGRRRRGTRVARCGRVAPRGDPSASARPSSSASG